MQGVLGVKAVFKRLDFMGLAHHGVQQATHHFNARIL